MAPWLDDTSSVDRHMQEEHLWNYAPDGGDSCSGTTQPYSAAELPFVQSTNATIGSTYIKVWLS